MLHSKFDIKYSNKIWYVKINQNKLFSSGAVTVNETENGIGRPTFNFDVAITSNLRFSERLYKNSREKDNSDFKKCGERNGETLPRNRDGNAQFPAFFLLYTLYKARTPLEVGDYVMA